MKKLFLLIPLFILLLVFVYFINSNEKFLLNSNMDIFKNDNKAAGVLYNYLRDDELIKLYPDKCTKQNMFAFEYDLNDDGINEILGYPDCTFYQGSFGKTLFILKNENEDYITIWKDNFVPIGIKISSKKTHNFSNIKITRAGLNFKTSIISDKECVIKYNGKQYIQPYNLFNKIKLYLGEF